MKLRQLAILLITALLASFFAPARASWSCPDGTPCVAEHGHMFRCASGQCRHASCCEAARPTFCKHGAVPGVAARHSGVPIVDSPDDCRFMVIAPVHPAATKTPVARLLTLSPGALPVFLAPVLLVRPAAPAWRSEFTLGYRPPPLLLLGPSRAPPAL